MDGNELKKDSGSVNTLAFYYSLKSLVGFLKSDH